MNYRHAFHAGNHADLLKHMSLLLCLERLKQKPAPFAALDTHAGLGLYDLQSEEAERSPEWRGGIARLWQADNPPAPALLLRDAVAAFNPDGALRFYPGSPALIAQNLREHDRLDACELHPSDSETLKRRFAKDKRVRTHARDGWEALGALLPFPERRGLILIDPPYEEHDELTRAARALGPALRRFGHGVFLWWRPFKSESALNAADAEARAQGAAKTLRADLWVDAPAPSGRLSGSSMLIINPPFGVADALREGLSWLAPLLAAGAAGWRVEQQDGPG